MKNIILSILAVVCFCQCDSHKNEINQNIKEIDSSYIDRTLLDIIHQYENTYPEINSFAIRFDIYPSLLKKYESGIYFIISDYNAVYKKGKDANLALRPSFYFTLHTKKFFVFSNNSMIFCQKNTMQNEKTSCPHDKALQQGWLIQYIENYDATIGLKKEYHIVNKHLELEI